MEVSGQLHAPAALRLHGKRPWYLFHRRLGGLRKPYIQYPLRYKGKDVPVLKHHTMKRRGIAGKAA
jgi:hypothetical protein